MKIPDYDTGVKTTVRVIKYEAGSNFTKILDSTDYPVKESFDMPVDENKDYKLILLPKNRQHTITNVHFGNEKRKGSTGLDSEQCYASVAFTFDGSSKTQVYWIEYGRPTLVDISL